MPKIIWYSIYFVLAFLSIFFLIRSVIGVDHISTLLSNLLQTSNQL